jgi:DNA polymerase-3 subunit gamma/tau
MDNVQYAPSAGRYKVYLIDEVHMFSGHSFNALLKTLEEPPPHVIFLLATTESKKIPVTILSRCLQFNLKHLSVEQIEGQLEKILELESIESDAISRSLISKSADGSLRDALSLLDQAIAYGDGRLQEAQVRTMLGTIDNLELNELLDALVSGDAQAVLQCTDHMAGHNPDYDSVLVELLSILQRIAISQIVGSDDIEQDETINALSQRISKEDVQLYYQVGIMGRKDLPVAPDPRSGFEMTLIRMLAFRPAAVATPEVGEIPDRSAMDKTTKIRPAETKTVETGQIHDDKIQGNAAASTEHVQAEVPQPDITEKNIEPEGISNWQSIIDEMALVGLVKELAGHCALKQHSKDRVHLVLSPDKEHLLNQTQKDRLASALEMRFGKDTQLKISIEEPEAETPAQMKAREEREKQQAAESSLKGDDNVRAMEEMFGATLDEKSIRPV